MIELKRQLRKQMKNILTQYFSSQDTTFISQKICEKLLQTSFYKSSEIVLSFVTGKLEIDTSFLNEKALIEKTLAIPKVINGTQMEFFALEKNQTIESQIEKGAFGIGEPKETLKKLELNLLNGKNVLVIVPGIAFTKDKKRCGHGKGFYDRFIPRLIESGANVKLCGICFPCQIVSDLPTDEFDKKVDFVIF